MTFAAAPLDGVTLDRDAAEPRWRATYAPGDAAPAARLFAACDAAGVATAFGERDGDVLLGRAAAPEAPHVLGAVVRNRAADAFAARYGVEVGRDLDPRVVEWRLEVAALGRPLCNDATAVAIGAVDEHDLEGAWEASVAVNEALGPWLEARGLDLVELALRFARGADGAWVVLGPFAPASLTLWDLDADEDATPVPRDVAAARILEDPA